MTVFVICFCFDLCIFLILFPHHPLPKSHMRGEQPDCTRSNFICVRDFPPQHYQSSIQLQHSMTVCVSLSHKIFCELNFQVSLRGIATCVRFHFISFRLLFLSLNDDNIHIYKCICYVCLPYTYRSIVNQMKSMEKRQWRQKMERGWGWKFYYYVHDIRWKKK